MAKTILAISLLVGTGACTSSVPTSHPGVSTTSTIEPPTTEQSTTTTVTEPPTTTTTEAPEPVEVATTAPPTTRARSAPTTTVYEPPSPQSRTVQGDDFWYRLATCESGNGALSANQFQFMGGTAEKVGYYPGASYAEQKAMAQDWAARIHPNEGTNAGWPVCWHVALGGGS